MRSTAQPLADPRMVGTKALAEEIFSEHRSRLLAIARRNSASSEQAEEALQDAFVLFIAHFDPAGGAPAMAWLTLTLKRRCWALHRRRRRDQSRQRSVHDPTRCSDDLVADGHLLPEELAELREQIGIARSRLAALKPQEREALGLLGFGYSYREICALTG